MFHEGQILLWSVIGCGRYYQTHLQWHPDAWCGITTPICSQCFNNNFVISVLNILSLSYDTHSPRWCLVCSREALPVWRWSLSATYTSACRYPIWLRTLLGFLDLLFTALNITCCPMDAVTFDLSCPGGGWSIPDPSSIMCKNDFKIGGIELDSDVVGKEPVNYCWKERYPSRRIRFRCCSKSTCKFLLKMKIFFTKYLAALKIMET